MKTILIINSGSSTIKFSIFTNPETDKLTKIYSGIVDCILTQPHLTIKNLANNAKEIDSHIEMVGDKPTYYKQAIKCILAWIDEKGFDIIAAGHRIVHSGPNYSNPVIIDSEVLTELEKMTPLMPLHQPFNLKGIKILCQASPKLFQVGCFDTGFHATCNPISQHYALPKYLTDEGIRRYGFHGLSYEYIADQLPNYMSHEEAQGKFIIAHLGNGATMCGIKNQQSVATSIGATGLGGLPMGTRCDSIDPGLVLYLMEKYNWDTMRMQQLFYKESGLLGVSNLSSDMRVLLASDKPEAKLAIDIFVHRISIYAGLLAAELQGFDGFIFTGGIGENASPIREQVCDRLTWLGVLLDKEKNYAPSNAARKINQEKSKTPVWVMPTDEESMIAKHTLSLLQKNTSLLSG